MPIAWLTSPSLPSFFCFLVPVWMAQRCNSLFSQDIFGFVIAEKAQVKQRSMAQIYQVFHQASMHNIRSLELVHLNGMQLFLMLSISPVLFLLWHAKMSAAKKVYFTFAIFIGIWILVASRIPSISPTEAWKLITPVWVGRKLRVKY